MRRIRFRVPLLAAVLALASLTAASASDFTIAPTSLTLTNEPAGDIGVTNTGTSLIRLSVHAYAWSQDAGSIEKLTDSDKIVYFPEIFVLPPGGTQRIRVGVAGGPTDKEQTFRLLITELPSPQSQTGSTGVTFVGRVDMPVFVPPGNSIPQTRVPKIDGVHVDRGAVVATLGNEGTVHVRQSNLDFTATDRGGNAIWHDTKQPFYILAGATQNVHAQIPASICPKVASVAIVWSLRDNGGQLKSSTSAISCR